MRGASQGPVPAGPHSAPNRPVVNTKPETPQRAQAAVCEHVFEMPDSLSVLNELAIPVWVVDFETPRILWGNRSTCYYFGKDLDELVGMELLKDRSATRAAVEAELFTKVQLNKGTEHTRKSFHPDGMPSVTFDLELRPVSVQLPDEQKPRTVALNWGYPVLDSSVHNESTRAMEMLRYSDILMMLFQDTGELLNSNVRARSFYMGTEAESAEGRARVKGRAMTLRDVLETCVWDDTKSTLEGTWTKVCNLSAGDNPIVIECRKVETGGVFRCASDGKTEIIHSLKFIPTYDPVTGARCLLVNETDVSELSSARTEQRELLAETKVKEKFLTAVSHELRTPLNGIIGLSDSLLNDPSVSSSVRRLVQVIRSSGQQLNVLVGDLIDTAAMSNKTFLISKADADVSSIVASAVGVAGPMIRPGVDLRNEVTGGLPTIRGDAGRIQQALTSVLGNSAKFTESGQIRVSAKHHQESNEVCIKVSDTGIGIEESTIKTIFSSFTQADMSSTRSHGGTGLGLALVKNIMQAHGGSISVVSSTMPEDHGSCFSLTFPLDPPAEDTSRAPTQQAVLSSSESKSGGEVDLTVQRLKEQLEKALQERNRFEELLKNERLQTERLQTVVQSPKAKAVGKAESPSVAKEVPSHKCRPTHSKAFGGIGEVLSVDDDPLNRLLVEQILEPAGYVVVTCTGSMDALKTIQSRAHVPDVILMDKFMPDVEGYECIRQIRETFDQSQIPIIVTSGSFSKESVQEGIERGCTDFLFKPFQRHELLARVMAQVMLSSHRSAKMSSTEAIVKPPPMKKKAAEPAIVRSHSEPERLNTKASPPQRSFSPKAKGLGSLIASQKNSYEPSSPRSSRDDPKKFSEDNNIASSSEADEDSGRSSPFYRSRHSDKEGSATPLGSVMEYGRGRAKSHTRSPVGRGSPRTSAVAADWRGMSRAASKLDVLAPKTEASLSSPLMTTTQQPLTAHIEMLHSGVLDVSDALRQREDFEKGSVTSTKLQELAESLVLQSQKAQEIASRYESQFPKVVSELDSTKAELSTALLNNMNMQYDHNREMVMVAKRERFHKKEIANLREEWEAQKSRIGHLETKAQRMHDELDSSIEEEDAMRRQLLDLNHRLALEEREKDNLLREMKGTSSNFRRMGSGDDSPGPRKAFSGSESPAAGRGQSPWSSVVSSVRNSGKAGADVDAWTSSSSGIVLR
mmetsp:Transcript_9085/g.22006  ORF Transcript_9085/g.22006 Transcript_9085/m.22006 type:complete len:1198 (+) Transcript_9085:177-3770(+)